MTITEFLEARIAEDEAAATRCVAAFVVPDALARTTLDPARALAECAAKRAIIRSYNSCIGAERATTDFGPRLVTSGMVKGLEIVLKISASVYSDHADYQQEWAQ